MKPNEGTYLLLRWTGWLASAVEWKSMLNWEMFSRSTHSYHAVRVAGWAKDYFNQWRAVTFP